MARAISMHVEPVVYRAFHCGTSQLAHLLLVKHQIRYHTISFKLLVCYYLHMFFLKLSGFIKHSLQNSEVI